MAALALVMQHGNSKQQRKTLVFLTVPDTLNMWILSLLCQGSFVLNFVVIRNIHILESLDDFHYKMEVRSNCMKSIKSTYFLFTIHQHLI